MFGLGGALRDLTEAASKGELELAIDRDELVAQVLETQSWVLYKNVLVLGREGVGATQLVYSVVQASLTAAQPDNAPACRYYELDAAVLKAGTVRVREAVFALIKEFRNRPDRILFIAHIAPLLDDTAYFNSPAATLGAAIQGLKLRCIGTMSPKEYERLLAANPSIVHTAKVFRMGPISEEAALRELARIRPTLERQHGVRISEKVLERTIQLTQEYLPDWDLPGKATMTLKRACELHNERLQGQEEGLPGGVAIVPRLKLGTSRMELSGAGVESHDLKCALQEMAKTDVFAAQTEKWKRKLARRMATMIFGQEPAIEKLAAAVAEIRVRFARPICPAGVILLGGPAGVGKSHAARVLTFCLTQSPDDLLEFKLRRTNSPGVDELFGAIHAAGSKKPVSRSGIIPDPREGSGLRLVLIKGIERAQPTVLGPLLRIITSGCRGDLPCRTNPQRTCLFILTLNTRLPREGDPGDARWLQEMLASRIRGDIVEAFDAIIPFGEIDFVAQCAIMERAMAGLYQKAKAQQIRVSVSDEAFKRVSIEAETARADAAELLAALKRLVIDPVEELLERAAIPTGGAITVSVHDGGILISPRPPSRFQ